MGVVCSEKRGGSTSRKAMVATTEDVRRGPIECRELSGSLRTALTQEEPALHSELSEAEWNVRELLERLEGDQDLLRELLQLFRADSQTSLMKARKALAQEDLVEVSRTAHALKGMLKNLSMNASAELAAALETAARNGARGEADALLQRLDRSLAGILPEVEMHLAEVRA
jgi:HPt (histidine-containing phosphotransfer) domain-containing protein